MKAKALEYSIADLVAGRRKDKKAFLSQIDLIVDWKPLCAIIEKAYTKGRKHNGRPCHSPLVLFKVELLRTWYGLSDAEVESQVNDRLSFSRFVGISLDDVCPDSTSLCRFRKAMVAAAVYDDLLNELNRQLEQRGVLVKQGAIVDASITDSPRRPRGRKEYTVVEDRKEDDGLEAAGSALDNLGCARPFASELARHSLARDFVQEAEKPNVDREARWVKKAGKLRFGFKRHTTTNLDGLILAEETTAANESGIKHLTTSIDKRPLCSSTTAGYPTHRCASPTTTATSSPCSPPAATAKATRPKQHRPNHPGNAFRAPRLFPQQRGPRFAGKHRWGRQARPPPG